MATPYVDPNLVPAAPAPPGKYSQLIDPPSENYRYIVCLVLAIALSIPWVLVRFYVRRLITRKLWWDDWAFLLGWMFYIAMCALLFVGLHYGGGTDIWNVSQARHKNFLKLFHDLEIVARIGMFFTKVSILLFFQRLFIPPGTSCPRIWWSIWSVFWWNFLYALALVLTVILECVGKAEKVAKGENCLDEFAILICASVINVVTDLMLLFIPCAAIWGLHMSSPKKWRLCAVFAVGILGVVASAARLGYQIDKANNLNSTVVTMILSLMNTAEQLTGIIVPCMPVLPAFYRHIASSRTWVSGIRMSRQIPPASNNAKKDQSDLSGLKPKPKDPFPIYYSTRGNCSTAPPDDLNDLEAQQRLVNGGRGIVKKVELNVIAERT